MDHAGAFGHACETVGRAGVGGEGEGCREEFRECVGGADRAGGGEPGFMGVAEGFEGAGDCGEDFVDGEALADYAGGHHEGGWGILGEAELSVEGFYHAVGVLESASAGDGVRTTRIDYYGADAVSIPFCEGLTTDSDRGRLKLVLGEDCGRAAWLF